MARNAARRARHEAAQRRREELAAEWEENVRQVNILLSTPQEQVKEDELVQFLFYSSTPYEKRITKEEYVEEGIEKWEREQPIVVSGRYRDEKRISNSHKNKFVEFTRACRPDIFAHLLDLKAPFRIVFGGKRLAFERMFDWHLVSELVSPDYSLDREIWSVLDELCNRHGLTLPRFEVRPNKHNLQDYSHRWGNFRLLIDVALLQTMRRRGDAIENQLLRTRSLVKSCFHFPTLANPSSGEIDQYLEVLSKVVTLELIDRSSYTISTTRRIVGTIIDSDSEEIVDAFLDFVVSILDWSEKYGLEKDWLLRYACWFLDHACQDEAADIMTVPVPILLEPSLYTDTFEFKFDEWYPGSESREDYEVRINRAFGEALDNFFQYHGRSLNLDRSRDDSVKAVTRPIDPGFEAVRWLIAWNEGATYEQIASEFDKEEEKTVRRGIRNLSSFELPVRKGRSKVVDRPITQKRLHKIREAGR